MTPMNERQQPGHLLLIVTRMRVGSGSLAPEAVEHLLEDRDDEHQDADDHHELKQMTMTG